jgi:hypothetical protein
MATSRGNSGTRARRSCGHGWVAAVRFARSRELASCGQAGAGGRGGPPGWHRGAPRLKAPAGAAELARLRQAACQPCEARASLSPSCLLRGAPGRIAMRERRSLWWRGGARYEIAMR